MSEAGLRIALLGTRGVPASYGGFETAVEEVGRRLAARGHEVTVYCRGKGGDGPPRYLGMHLVHLPAVRRKVLETLSHTALSTAHLLAHPAPDVAVVFNAANSLLLPLLRARGVPVATHMDGLEWKRAKWHGAGRRYYRASESLGVRWSDALIADAQGIADYYRDEFGARTDLIAYGAPILRQVADHRLHELGVRPDEFHVLVARFEPENNVLMAVEGALQAGLRHPLLVVGAAPYAHEYTRRIQDMVGDSGAVRLVGPVYDQEQLDQLYAHALTYVHGHSVGGTNPSLLRAMGAGTAVLAFDVNFNREVAGERAQYFQDAKTLAALLSSSEAAPQQAAAVGHLLQERAAALYRWDDVADRYEDLCRRLSRGQVEPPALSGRRRTR